MIISMQPVAEGCYFRAKAQQEPAMGCSGKMTGLDAMKATTRELRSRSLLASLLVSTLAQAQVPMSFDSIAGERWESLTIEKAKTLYSELPHVEQGPPARAYLVGGPCITVPGYTYVDYSAMGVRSAFSPPDTTGRQALKSVTVSKPGAVAASNGVNVGDEIRATENSDGSMPKEAMLGGRTYVHVFDKGTFFYCKPSSLRRAKKGKPMKVVLLVLREHF